MSDVYIRVDDDARIVACDGGYSSSNISDISEWVMIDSGEGDRYNLCQSHYFDGGLFTDDGFCRWKYSNGECVLRSDDEIEADRAAIVPKKSELELMQEQIDDMTLVLAEMIGGM